MRRTIGVLAAGAALAWAGPASADPVCEWMDFAARIAAASGTPPATAVTAAPRNPELSRAQTRVSLAMFEALNAIDRRYDSYLDLPLGDASASQEAAAVTAAYQVLLNFYPAQKAALDENYAVAMEGIPAARREAGRLIGEGAARAAIAAGGIDPAVVQTPYRPRTAAGQWTATALPVIEPYSIAFKPWILPNAAAVRPAPPPALDSERWARDFDEVRRLGARESTERTPHQTLMARYRITPDMMPTLRTTADAPGRALVQNARLFALVNMASDDASMATGEAKLHYNFWRPIAAIRNGTDDGNPATAEDRAWEPLIATPNHPEYPCAHCSGAAVIAEVMSAETGPRPASGVRVASRSIPNSAVQVMPTWDDWVREVSLSRTLGGVHYRFSNEAGEELGRAVGRMANARLMRPLPAGQQRRAR